MTPTATFLCFVLILSVQFEQYQAIPTALSSIEEIPSDVSAWYDMVAADEDKQLQHPLYGSYKRFLDELLLPERQRRFGNTKYGRSVPSE